MPGRSGCPWTSSLVPSEIISGCRRSISPGERPFRIRFSDCRCHRAFGLARVLHLTGVDLGGSFSRQRGRPGGQANRENLFG